MQNKIKIPMKLLNRGMELGLGEGIGDVAKTIGYHLTYSAPVTHELGNRRYDFWLYTVEYNTLTKIHYASCSECLDRGYSVMYEECPKCYGDKCKACNYTGEVLRKLVCQTCKKTNKSHKKYR